jgi:hypothetical protein
MQVEASAQESPGSVPNLRHNWNHLMKRPAFQEPVIDAMIRKACKSGFLRLSVFAAFLILLAPSLVAQTGNVVISTNTTWATGTYNLTSLSVVNGAMLTIGGGSTVTVSGAVLVTANSNVVLQSINNAAQVNNTWQGAGVTLNAGSVQVEAGSSINADGQGYLASAGPGGAPAGSSAGGSYGGMGGVGENATPAAPIYGSNTTPTDLGSGGGFRCCGAIPGPGGGAVRLIVSGTLTDNGVISANGANLIGYQGGGGSGGSVYVTTAALAGSGVFSATGGTGGEAAGGGGRIAVYYNGANNTFTGFSASTAVGGSCETQCSNGTASAGGTGTVAFFDTSATNTNLMVDQDFTIPAQTNVTYNSITVQPGAVLTIGGGSTVTVANSLTVNGTVVAQSINNSVLVNNTWQGTGVNINAASVVVNTNGSINADGQGYVAGAGPGGSPSGSSAGGSYGGLGGVGNGVSPAGIYGSTTMPTDLGSGGNTRCCGTIPGAGGGELTITVSGTLTDNGIISANGGNGSGLQVGGGSGGTVSMQIGTLTGSGSVAANGGLGGEAGGGGGRVAIYFNANSGLNLALVTATGGSSSSGNPGAAGTVYTLGAGSNLIVSNDTTLPANANLSFSSVTVNNGATLTLGSGTTFASNTVTVTAGGNFTVGGGSTLNISGAVLVTGNSMIVLQSINDAAQVNGTWQGVGVTLTAGSVQVDAGSSINADGQGYLASAGPGGAPPGSSAGGSYGGLGGVGDGVPPGGIYGSTTTPSDLGSGGGFRCCGAIPGPGGGLVRLIVGGTLTDNGVISANGANLIGFQGGGGSGGSVWVTTAGLAGSGVFTANGGTGGEAAGGGGRIAVYYNAPTSSFTGFQTSTSNGGSCQTQCSNGTSSAGGVGTVAFFDTSATNTNLMVDQDLTIPAGSTVNYNSITVQPGAVLTIGGGSTVTVANLLTVSGTVVAQSINNTALVNGTWQGTGVNINAASVVVNANGSINADGQGYVVSAGPGGAPAGSSNGGSYGGPGGVGLGASTSQAIYGSTTAPTDLGSGGGLRCCSTSAGAGGGALTFTVSGSFTNNGIVSANGGAVVGYQAGGGSGGSVYVRTAALSGSGAFTANGGVGGEAGGGGGRVAIYYDAPSSNFTGFAASTATGGACGVSAGSACTDATTSGGSNGTAAFFDTSAPNDNLAIYQDFTIPAGTSATYNTVTVQSGAVLTLGGASTLTVTDALTVSGTVVGQSANNTAQVNSVWVGSGVAINAGSITVNANGSLNADAEGYVAGAGPGGAPGGSSAGGSYGGLGGAGNGVPPAGTYGSITAPIDLGSGGNTRCCGTIPGAGGGALLLTVSGTLTDNGVISANGGNGSGLQVGGGSGGTVSIHTATVAGSGSIAANGGSGGEAGGGGGRIALCFNTNGGFNLALATANGGNASDGNAGAVGTVYTPCVAATSVSVTATPAVVDQGSTVTFTGTVSPASPASVVPTGTLTFAEGQVTLATVTLAQGSAMFSTSTLGAGVHVITVTYSGDATFQSSSFRFTQTIRAIPTISWATPAGITYGTPLSGIQLNATASSPSAPNGLPGTFMYQPAAGTVLSAGQQTLTVVFTPADLVDYAPSTKSVSILVGQATPTIAWAPAVPSIIYGTPLGAQQLNATATGVGGVFLTGTFVYTPAAGTVLNAGTQTLNVAFNPSNTNYGSARSTATITVTQATPTLTWPTPANLAYGVPLGTTQLNAVAAGINGIALPGTYVYTPAAGALLNPGPQTLSVTFTPTDAVDYTNVSSTVTLTITDLTLTAVTPNTAQIGDPAKTITVTGTGFIATTVVMVNGSAVATTYVNPTTLTAVVPAANFTAGAVLQITLKNPATGSTSASEPLTVSAPVPGATFTGPTSSQPGTQPAVTLSLSAPYPVPLTATFTLTQKSALPSGVVDPAVQFAAGGTTYTVTIPAGSTTIPPIQVQSGTVAGTIIIPVVLTANGINVTPTNLAPVTIIVPAAVPNLSTASLTRSGTQLSVSVIGFSNTREIVQANFHFTPVAGASLTTTDIPASVAPSFATWFADPSSVAFGSAFTYTQNFTVSDDAAKIASVQVTLTNGTGVSTAQTAQ